MPRRPTVLTALLVTCLSLQAACGGYSENHRNGLLAASAVAVFAGSIMAVDGAWCDRSAGGRMECDDDRAELRSGLSLLAVGLAIGGVAWLVRPRAEEAPPPGPIATSADPADAADAEPAP
jgi:hypothetical protein